MEHSGELSTVGRMLTTGPLAGAALCSDSQAFSIECRIYMGLVGRKISHTVDPYSVGGQVLILTEFELWRRRRAPLVRDYMAGPRAFPFPRYR